MTTHERSNVHRLFKEAKTLSTSGGGGGEPPRDAELHARVARLEATVATKTDIADLRSELHKAVSDLIKWIVGTLFVAVALCVTLMTFVLNNATPKVPPSTTPAPIIIQMPGTVPPSISDP